jgi:hydroxyacyl-ACP dehydratase HTD2-like protein with hotdog domain
MTAPHARSFESVAIGEEIELARGPLTTAHLMRWSAAMENWHKIHYDAPFTIEHEKLPGLLVNGSLKQQFIMTLLRNWAGRSGWAWKVGFQFRAMNLVGETLTVWAKVTGKRPGPQFGLIDLAVGIRNAAGTESTPGTAIVALPFAGGAPVPYPFVPPRES